ncbi:DNA-binding CsgD family transcriptional regulator [Kineococcus radiotolerans]|uniref:DNA-binding CsgD family transcriptional regulator n=1 Tax=Kineococcus radiotolerans TaxID=131568 RepID=A0A7W4TQE5_KINRA|nr:helix-turn-helix transcriptional regulator [Kineococcus radiotolerans]MBB2903201.1 DNA-binding CsgD family transcriptional regulator [Kineococcus radiotolerans]
MHDTDQALASALWPHLLDAIAAGDRRMYLQARSGERVVMISESELQQMESELRRLQQHMAPAHSSPGVNRLTAREAETLQLVAEGLSGAQIAERLGRSANTIAQHLATIRRKYGVRSSTAAVEAARRAGHLPAAGQPPIDEHPHSREREPE